MRCGAAIWLPILFGVAPLGAQQPAERRWRPEVRVEATLARETALHAGAGVGRRVARAVEVAAIATAAVAREDDAADIRLEGLGRFLIDPDRRSDVGLYAAAGIAALRFEENQWRGVLVMLVGADLGRSQGWGAFVEGGYGGGLRLGAGLRRR